MLGLGGQPWLYGNSYSFYVKFVVVFLWVTYKKGQSELAAQPGPVQFVAGQGVVLPPVNQLAEAAAPAA